MTPVFKVVMKHTREVLKDFVRFDNHVRHPMTKVHLTVLGIGFLVLGILTRESLAALLVFGGLGVILLVILFTRHTIAFTKLAAQDEDYIKQTETLFDFGQSEVVVKNSAWDADVHVRYGEISNFYIDDKNYYVVRNNEELYLLPFKDFSVGKAKDFGPFFSEKTSKECKPTKLPFGERLRRVAASMKASERLHDEKIKEKKKNLK